GMLEAIRFSDMKFKDKLFGYYPLPVLALTKVEGNKIQLKGKFKEKMNSNDNITYRLYKRYIDFNTDRILKMLINIDERSSSLFLDLLKDPNKWGSTLPEEHDDSKKLKSTALALRNAFSMSPSQKDISESLLKKRLQIIWGPPGSGKTHFLALFVTWYLTEVKPQPVGSNRNFNIGITACTRTAIDNLLERIAKVKDEAQADFILTRMVSELNKNSLNGVKDYKAIKLADNIANEKNCITSKPIIIGGTVWDWHKFHDKCKNWTGCDIMIIDEGSQLLTSDACAALECLNPNGGRLIIAGDHMQLGPIIQNTYPVFSDNHPLILGSIQQCLMRKEDGSTFDESDFFLNKGQKHDFGPCTLQLKDNWRMNDKLNSFFQKIYVKLSLKNYEVPGILSEIILREEANLVAKIVSSYFDATRKINQSDKQPSLFIVTPHHRQRYAIRSRVDKYLSNSEIDLQINTVEKMQGQEADLVIACFGFLDVNEIARESDFLFDRNRWNVAISRARCKVILLTTDEILYPEDMEIFTNKKTSEGWLYISMIESWVRERIKEKESEIIECVIDENLVIENDTKNYLVDFPLVLWHLLYVLADAYKKSKLTTEYSFEEKSICKNAFKTIYSLGDTRWKNLRDHFIEHDINLHINSKTEKVGNSTISFKTVMKVITFIGNFAKQNSLSSPEAINTNDQFEISLITFIRIWKKFLLYIKKLTLHSNLCLKYKDMRFNANYWSIEEKETKVLEWHKYIKWTQEEQENYK
ncbi:25214_t:CDS:10, partial [Cetraspora pellucida]